MNNLELQSMTNTACKKHVQHLLPHSTVMMCNFRYKVELIIYTIVISHWESMKISIINGKGLKT